MCGRKREVRTFFILATVIILIAGCSSTSSSGGQEPEVLIAGSASQGGANYLIMSGWAPIMGEHIGIEIRNESTGGPAANMQLMHSNQAQIGVLSGIVAREGMDGEGWADGNKLENVRALFGLHSLYMDGLALKDSGIKNLRDLEGRRVSVGPAGGTPYVLVKRVLDILGIEPEYVELGQGDSIDALKNRQLDAVIFAGAFPRPAYVELESSHEVNFLSLTDQDLEKVLTEYPSFRTGVIPAGTYKNLKEDNNTLVDRYIYGVSADLSEDLVYRMVKNTVENFEEWQKVHKSLKRIDIQTMGDVAIPLHPGAVKALKELGIEVPDHALPPEMK